MREDWYEALEAVLMVSAEPLTADDLAQGLGIDRDSVENALADLAADYDGLDGSVRRGFQLRAANGGWRISSREEQFGNVKDFLVRGQSSKMSQAALETLAVVAYAQPVTRARISAIRGVNVDGVVRTLMMRGLIVEVDGDHAGGARQYVTSQVFLESMGIDSLDQLPNIAPYLPEDVPADD
ncbi:SMC-Scp complex subunit ScpB [Brevibacterium sp. HMSC07C04]|uniref:SMC-Scp complex subunit ScpB n=1 Tax=Brevibacterium sp. HMSC07C04 TaxID=1581130 RepID=UPI0008A24A4D|nr:SMC-Scp complex subunit ScpB [Brevibacterium sp. HMSC07C04]OFS26787.1 SMC-Scp complex subunit ScpB [Brevibacterium sp. HMSC07C04]